MSENLLSLDLEPLYGWHWWDCRVNWP